MTTREWLRGQDAAIDAAAIGIHEQRFKPLPAGKQRFSLVDWLRLFVLRRRVNAMLRRTVPPIRYEDARSLPPHILKDIGL